jgi:hypothetical protein
MKRHNWRQGGEIRTIKIKMIPNFLEFHSLYNIDSRGK